VTPAVVTRHGHDRFRPVVELLTTAIANGPKRHNVKVA
jgi:hypothetical protein